jgi:hypothetical protein
LLQKYSELRHDLIRTERHLLKEMGFICHVEHPHKFISNYLATLEAPPELTQEAWNLANDRYFWFHITRLSIFLQLKLLLQLRTVMWSAYSLFLGHVGNNVFACFTLSWLWLWYISLVWFWVKCNVSCTRAGIEVD